MTTVGFFLSTEEHSGSDLVGTAIAAEEAGFTAASISDHFHPWLPEQGHSPFVWCPVALALLLAIRAHGS